MEISNVPQPSQVPNRVSVEKNRLFIVVVVVLLVIVLIVGGYYMYSSRSTGKISESTSSKIAEVADIKNPVEFFYKNFSTKDYHVKVINKDGAQDFSFYFEKGVLVRVDGEGQYSSDNVSIIKNGKLYSLDETKRTFAEIDLNNPQAIYLISLYKVGSMLDPIIQGETPTASPWSRVLEKQTSDNLFEYQTIGRKFIPLLSGDASLADIKIILDTQSGLITAASIKSAKNPEWNWVRFEYEEISAMESFKNFPRDYKKVDSL